MTADSKELAMALIRQYGHAAEEIAKGHALKMEMMWDGVSQGYWLRVANFIARQRCRV